jgi:hypothetical protein
MEGGERRGKMFLDAKNEWADRARSAEGRVEMLKRDLQIVSGQRDRRAAERDGALEKNAVLKEELETLRRRVAGEEEWICPEGHRVSLSPAARCADCHKPMVSLTAVPMADVLREHCKALVRARNEGREEAARDADAAADRAERAAEAERAKTRPRQTTIQEALLVQVSMSSLAERIRAKKEPESNYPCSSTCTHDDAATPGHAERVKERSEAVLAAVTKCPKCGGEVEEGYGHASGAVQPAPYLYCLKSCGWRHTTKGEIVWNPTREQEAWFDSGAEAMRAACLAVVQDEKDEIGLTASQVQRLKAAIEGATP